MGRKNAGEAGNETGSGVEGARNLVRLRGRVSTPAEERELPSGTTIVSVRLSVPREATPMTTGSRQSHDWVDCTAWGGRARRTVAGWRTGDVVEVEGALRRRFYRGGGATNTRLEVEVLGARMVTRAPETSAPAG